jgi:predicted DNA-binding protein with PD1-like motif
MLSSILLSPPFPHFIQKEKIIFIRLYHIINKWYNFLENILEVSMRYQIGYAGRVLVVRFDDKEDILNGLKEISAKERIKNAVFYVIGGLRGGKVVVGPERDELPPVPIWNKVEESHEVIGIGTIFWQGDEPKIHLHCALGKRDVTMVGCLREISETFLIVECILVEISGINAKREHDNLSGLTLLKL